MKSAPTDEFEQVAGQLSQMMNKLWQWHTGDFCPVDTWSPAINYYRLERRIEICMDLSGVDRKHIDIRVEPGQLVVRGMRHAPEPSRQAGDLMRIDAMEIDHGRFCRTIRLPEHVDLVRVESEYDNGLLWIRLPLRAPG
jgi:HSP20 family molecular chaperone IbpA